MARRETKRLTDLGVKAITAIGRHPDGENLYFRVDKDGSRRWTFLYRWKQPGAPKGAGRLVEIGLGSLSKNSLAQARRKAEAYREMLGRGENPADVKKALEAIPTFGALADAYIVTKAQEFRSDTSLVRIKRALEHHAKPLRDVRVDGINADLIVKALKPIWTATPELAKKTRGYIEAVLNTTDPATQRGPGWYRGVNPAAWKGNLDHLLPNQPKVDKAGHAAMPYADAPKFVAALRERQEEATSALAHEFLILTAARAGEVLKATWPEIDLAEKTWTIAAARMKAGREHIVPLSDRCIEILTVAAERRIDDFVFPGQSVGTPMSTTTLDNLRSRMKVEGVTTHGFRSCFEDWAGDETSFEAEIIDFSLAHVVANKVKRAYRRKTALDKRRALMKAWATYLAGGHGAGVADLEQARKAAVA